VAEHLLCRLADFILRAAFCRWTLFLTLAVYASAVVVTALPSRLPRARFPLANLLSISSVLIMVSKLEAGLFAQQHQVQVQSLVQSWATRLGCAQHTAIA
jgi:hypothetical protein